MPVQAGHPLSLPDTGPCSCLRWVSKVHNASRRLRRSTSAPLDAPALSALYTMDPMHSSLGAVGPLRPPMLPAAPPRPRFLSTNSIPASGPPPSYRGLAYLPTCRRVTTENVVAVYAAHWYSWMRPPRTSCRISLESAQCGEETAVLSGGH
jgi:hypothetical protein